MLSIYVRLSGQSVYSGCLWFASSNNTTSLSGARPLGMRVVWKIAPDVRIIGGEGTKDVPFEIGL